MKKSLVFPRNTIFRVDDRNISIPEKTKQTTKILLLLLVQRERGGERQIDRRSRVK